LEAIQARAIDNGVYSLERVSARQIKAMEPQVNAVAGLFSPDTGIIDSHRLMRRFAAKARRHGAQLIFHTTVTGIDRQDDGRYRVQVIYPDRQTDSFSSDWIVNCAGLDADRMAASMGLDVDACGYRLHYWKGEYFSLDVPAGFLQRLVYPVPLPGHVGLGVHATLDLSGRVKLGPNAVYLPERSIDYSVDPSARQSFCDAARRYLPGISCDQIQPEMAGIRPKRQQPGDPQRDFIITEESARGLPGVVNLIGIESPGLTASPAIARHVAALMAERR